MNNITRFDPADRIYRHHFTRQHTRKNAIMLNVKTPLRYLCTKFKLAKKSICTIAIIMTSVQQIMAATLVHLLDFETAGWEQSFRTGAWHDTVNVVSLNSHGGKYCLRGNLKEGISDPITKLPGENNPQLEYIGNDISSKVSNEIFIRYWRRLDNSIWSGTEAGQGKGEYLTDTIFGTAAFFTGMWFLPNNYSLCDNGAFTEWCTLDANWSYSRAVLDSNAANPGGADGKWHKIEIYINYATHYITFWIDGNILHGIDSGSSECARFGTQIAIPPDFRLRGLQFFYVHPEQVITSTDGTGFACGWQLDDIEVWDGIPDADMIPPVEPANLHVR